MEESEKITGKKKLPSVPSNFVTLVQLQERWIKEREQKEKEENNQVHELKEQGEKEKQVEERVDEEVDGRESRRKGHFRRYNRQGGKRAVEWKPKEEEASAALAANQSEGVEQEKEKEGEKSKKKKKKWKSKKSEKAGAGNEGGEVVGTAANAPLPASKECHKGKEEGMIADEVHAPKPASAEEVNVEARTEDRTVEIGRKLGGMSMNGEIRRGGYRKSGRQNGGLNHRGGNRELNGSNYGRFGRRRELNQRNEGMVWVKKGEGSDGNVGGIQSLSCSVKEFD